MSIKLLCNLIEFFKKFDCCDTNRLKQGLTADILLEKY